MHLTTVIIRKYVPVFVKRVTVTNRDGTAVCDDGYMFYDTPDGYLEARRRVESWTDNWLVVTLESDTRVFYVCKTFWADVTRKDSCPRLLKSVWHMLYAKGIILPEPPPCFDSDKE